MKRLLEEDVPHYQKRGYFDEHLITLNAQAYGDPYIYEDTYLVYHDEMSKSLWLTLFELNGHKNNADRLECLKTAIAKFKPRRIVAASPEKSEISIGDYLCETTYFDRDYQIRLDGFDASLRGGSYECLRYRVNNAEKRGYMLTLGKEMTPAHSHVAAFHMSKRSYNLWDYQIFLRLGNYVAKSPSVKLFNVFVDDVLIGFDVVDFLDHIMVVPLGFYLDYQSLADFMMYKEILYAKEQGFEWLDIGWACSPGLEEFKKKWKGIPRFSIYVQEYVDKSEIKNREKIPVEITVQTPTAF